MAIWVVGLSYRTAPVEVRERFVFSDDAARRALGALTSGGPLREAVLLSTCNRTELYGYPADGSGAGGEDRAREMLAARAEMTLEEADRYLYRRGGADAVRHLYRVTSSLDSMVVGEAQIQGQVRTAYEVALSAGRDRRVVGPVLGRLFESALSVGGRVRSETRLGTGAASVPSAAVELARKIFGPLKGRRALILGAGQTSELALECLAGDGVDRIVVANRTARRAEALAGKVGGRSAGYAELPALLRETDIVMSATTAPHYMLTRATLEEAFPRGRDEPLLIVDLALPRDVEPAVGGGRGVFLYDMDDLRQIVDQNRSRRENEVPDAEAIIEEAAAEFWRWYASLDVVPVLRAMRERADRMRAVEVEKALRKLEHLSDADRAVVEALAVQLTNKLLHEPTVRLKEGAGNGQPVMAETARYLFDLADTDDETTGENG
ncbi:MAG: glutamyl-tRNA reductase [Gemmatimonadetes bacterium]|nr:glutamyl-tRNA reductase [Gemmatimonadota bacterium]